MEAPPPSPPARARPARSPALALAVALGAAACQGGGGAPAPPAGPAPGVNAAVDGNATAAGLVAAVDAAAAPPPVLELKGTAALATADGATTSLVVGAETTVPAGASFRVELPVALADARLSLLDGADAMLPASGSREVGLATVLTLAPAAALAPGARLTLRVDGAATRELHGADGRRFAPLEWPLMVAGEAERRKPGGRRPGRR